MGFHHIIREEAEGVRPDSRCQVFDCAAGNHPGVAHAEMIVKSAPAIVNRYAGRRDVHCKSQGGVRLHGQCLPHRLRHPTGDEFPVERHLLIGVMVEVGVGKRIEFEKEFISLI